MATLFHFPSSKAQVRTMSSANRAGVPGGKGLASMVSKLGTTEYPALFFFFPHPRQICFYQCTRFSQHWSEDLRTILLMVLSSGSKVSRQEWKRREPLRVGRRVAGLRNPQGDIVRPGFSISTTWYLRILWSGIHKWPLPFRSCFTWWLVKIVCPPKRVLKTSFIRIAIAARFWRQGEISSL